MTYSAAHLFQPTWSSYSTPASPTCHSHQRHFRDTPPFVQLHHLFNFLFKQFHVLYEFIPHCHLSESCQFHVVIVSIFRTVRMSPEKNKEKDKEEKRTITSGPLKNYYKVTKPLKNYYNATCINLAISEELDPFSSTTQSVYISRFSNQYHLFSLH